MHHRPIISFEFILFIFIFFRFRIGGWGFVGDEDSEKMKERLVVGFICLVLLSMIYLEYEN